MLFLSSMYKKNAILMILFCLFMSVPGIGAAEDELVESLRDFPANLRSEKVSVPILFRSIARKAGVNIYVPENIQGEISIDMTDVTLYEIFQLVVKTRGLYYTESNQTIILETLDDFLESGRGIITERVCTDFINGVEVKGQLETVLSERGSITLTSDENCFVLKDHPANIAVVKKMIAEIDQPIPQIHIESRIVFISKEGRDRLGVIWGAEGANNNVLGANSGSLLSSTNLGAVGASTSLAMGMIWDNFSLDLELQALLDDDLLQILSAPSLLVLDGQQAMIKNGKEVPYTSQSGNSGTNTEFREALLSLEVTPKISKNGYLKLDVVVTNDSVDDTNEVNGEPLINRQEIKTLLFLKDRVTVVIGGIHVSRDDLDISKVYGLGDIPLLGSLFKSTHKSIGNFELMIFLTPTIVSMDLLTEASERHSKKLDEALSPNIHKKFDPKVYRHPDWSDTVVSPSGGQEKSDP